jgi:dihydrolipoamide dehydrogenase
MNNNEFDVVVIGGGPGGYVSAIRASQLGAKVALIEKDKLGGVCTNVGCIPTKTLLYATEIIDEIKKGKEFGINVIDYDIDFKVLMKKKDKVVSRLRNGIEYLLKGYGVEVISGIGKLISDSKVKVEKDGKVTTLEAKRVIIAIGSKAAKPPIQGIDSDGVITSEEALSLEELPNSIVIAGGGAEGCEFARVFSSLGTEVTIVEMLPNLLPLEDKEIGLRVKQALTKRGVKVMVNTKVKKIEGKKGSMVIKVDKQGDEKELKGDLVFLGLGRSPVSQGLGLEEIGVQMTKGWIVVNNKMETSVRNIYAVGDATGGGFAHVAMEGGVVAAENCMGMSSSINLNVVPRCIYTKPEIACVGLSEDLARKRGIKYKIGRFLFTANGRAQTIGEEEGFVKVLVKEGSNEIIGVHMFGPNVSEVLAEACLAMSVGLKVSSISKIMLAHPTLSEVFKEACLDAMGKAIHKVKMIS